ncbi:alpha-amylase A-like [Neocloeon triangulifer]|uniref:alpha-amylase A-like n=1 Tax=Neocloeon triangulifer TaxID=2078957 RepID=UPI00286F4AB3|nr:alpha-amylase A-like [Neocloeon triangulifer]
MQRSVAVVAALLAVASVAHGQYDLYAWPNRSTIVHLFEWRWEDVARECEEYLAPNHFAGVQLSPVAEHLKCDERGRPWWEVYQPLSYNIITRSGDELAFADMVSRCNAVGVRIIVDVVLNHMSGDWDPAIGIDGTTADTVARDYPGVPYTVEHFNPFCEANNYQDANIIRNCEIAQLHDLNTSIAYVRDKQVEYLNKLVGHGVTGFRVDAAKHIWPEHLADVMNRVNDLPEAQGFPPGARPFVAQEVIDFGTGEAVTKDEYYGIGYITEFRYGSELGRAMRGNNPLKWYFDFGENWGFAPDKYALVFNDNHDNQRGHGAGGQNVVTYKDPKWYKQAQAFMLAWPHGYPRLMSSFDFTDTEIGPPMDANENILPVTTNPDGSCGNGWVCEHRWNALTQMVSFRNTVVGTNVTLWWDNGNNMVSWSREGLGFIVINGEAGDLDETLSTGLPAGTYCDVISGKLENGACTGLTIVVAADGTAAISLPGASQEGVMATHINAKIA